MKGRKPKPTRLKLLAGNPGKRAINRSEPTLEAAKPTRPTWLKGKARTAWDQLVDLLYAMGVMTEADGKALELLCDAYAEYREAREYVIKHGPTYESATDKGLIVRKRPEVAIAADAQKRVASLLAEFGITPSSRSRVSSVLERVGENRGPSRLLARRTDARG